MHSPVPTAHAPPQLPPFAADANEPLAITAADASAALLGGLLAGVAVISVWLLGALVALGGVCARTAWPRARRAARRGGLLAAAPRPPLEPPAPVQRGAAARAALTELFLAPSPWDASPLTNEDLAQARSASPLGAADAAQAHAAARPQPQPRLGEVRGVVFAHAFGEPGGSAARAQRAAVAAAEAERATR